MTLPLIIAHRGGKFWESDDFSYITESIQAGADIIELDVRQKNGTYIVQHMPWEKIQGKLDDAIKLSQNAKLYLDIKIKIDINEFISYIRSICPNEIIIGTYDLRMLRDIKDDKVIRNCHCALPWNCIERGRKSGAQWVNIMCHAATKNLAQRIQRAGFEFVPSGNQIFKKHEITGNILKYAKWGAFAISTHHVKEVKKLLTKAQF